MPLMLSKGLRGLFPEAGASTCPLSTLMATFAFNVALYLCSGALLEKKVDMDKRGLGVTDYNGMVTKPLGCRPPISKESSMDRPTFLDKVIDLGSF